jgi:eukaryotic-like serine/threonine-protein kinase
MTMLICPTCKETFETGAFCPRDGAHLLPVQTSSSDEMDDLPTSDMQRPLIEDPLIGTIVADRFRIIKRIGIGGMGTVYEAEHVFINKRVALKLLRSEITSKPDAIARFQREALAASTIGHPGIVQIDDFGRLKDGQVYLTMEYLEGCPLSRVIADGPISFGRLVDLSVQTCHALAAAHAKGIIHRDLKPENLFVVDDGTRVKILDFGIAKVSFGGEGANLTQTGAIFGTPNYMAPEQALGKKVDHRADIYSMGIILYEMVTGVVPFQSESFLAILTQQVTVEPRPPSEVARDRVVHPAVEALVLKAIAKDPEARFQTMAELIGELQRVHQLVTGGALPSGAIDISQILPPIEERSTPAAPLHLDGTPPPSLPNMVTATAGELVQPTLAPLKRTRLLLGVGVAGSFLVGAAVLAAHFLLGTGDPPAGPRPPPPGPPGSVDPARNIPGKLPPSGPPRDPSSEGGPRIANIILISKPLGAQIFRGDQLVGETPDVVTAPLGGRLDVILRLKGYRDRRVELEVTEHKKLTIPLDPIDAPRALPTRFVAEKVRGPVSREDIKRARRPPGKKLRPDRPPAVGDHDPDRPPPDQPHDEVINPY